MLSSAPDEGRQEKRCYPLLSFRNPRSRTKGGRVPRGYVRENGRGVGVDAFSLSQVMPGDNVKVTVDLMAPVALEKVRE
jgi:translation elongation factor EF-Tu-like GTPase